jgi:hypothetical protein
LERWPTANALVTASKDELVILTRATRHGRPERVADRITQALAPRAPGRDELPL